ncbi:type I 3-dehydroquinate dehydratase [Candidatus Peregrinibacteria bacterium]|jgi:3-dehydroquinate dehydratase I|nr:type I 3-dehydroquinate dehydratase [Candidatus Peregrinibacteria bacterium]MBT7736788.1 type I 3-dehydroquinate dehydratase [Candidatus Peregrinibacteria bacterium]
MICIPIRRKTYKSALETFIMAQKKADVIEVWFDEIKDLTDENLSKLFKTKKVPVLYKYQDGKNFERIIQFKPEFIDFDLNSSKTLINKARKISPKSKIIVSNHDFDKTPETKDLLKVLKQMHQKGADICKIATYANKISDSIRMLSLLSQQNSSTIMICMGKEGRITRTTGHLFGNYLMYASLTPRDRTAEGQLTVDQLTEILNDY